MVSVWFLNTFVISCASKSIFLSFLLDLLICDYTSSFFRKVWDAITGNELHSFEHKHIVRSCAFSEVDEDLSCCPQVFLSPMPFLLFTFSFVCCWSYILLHLICQLPCHFFTVIVFWQQSHPLCVCYSMFLFTSYNPVLIR